MAGFNILKWLYKHSPVNFYSITSDGETIIKSINNTSVGYKYPQEFNKETIEILRKTIKNFKRVWTMLLLIVYAAIIYYVIFPNYTMLSESLTKGLIIFGILLIITFAMALINSKIFEYYLKKNFGNYEKVHFPSSNSIENQSYKDFKTELVKIFLLFIFLLGVYICIGSPYETTLKLISKQRYSDAIKMSTIWSKILPIDQRWYSMRAYAKFKTEDFQGAIEDYNKAYEIENDEFKTMNFDNKIYIKYYIKDYKGAIEDFDKEINNSKDIYEQDPFLWDKAQFLYNIGQYKQSLQIYDQLIINSENDSLYLIQSRLYYERGLVYQKMNKIEQAQADFSKAEELNLEETFKMDIPEPTILLGEIKEN